MSVQLCEEIIEVTKVTSVLLFPDSAGDLFMDLLIIGRDTALLGSQGVLVTGPL